MDNRYASGFEKNNQEAAYLLYLKYGWEVKDFNNFYHLKIIIPTNQGFKVVVDYWPSSGKCRINNSATFKTWEIEKDILKRLKGLINV
jgi:hypothetical protein